MNKLNENSKLRMQLGAAVLAFTLFSVSAIGSTAESAAQSPIVNTSAVLSFEKAINAAQKNFTPHFRAWNSC